MVDPFKTEEVGGPDVAHRGIALRSPGDGVAIRKVVKGVCKTFVDPGVCLFRTDPQGPGRVLRDFRESPALRNFRSQRALHFSGSGPADFRHWLELGQCREYSRHLQNRPSAGFG